MRGSAVACFFVFSAVSVSMGCIGDDVGRNAAKELGENLARAADKIDPIALKSILTENRDLRAMNEALTRKLDGVERAEYANAYQICLHSNSPDILTTVTVNLLTETNEKVVAPLLGAAGDQLLVPNKCVVIAPGDYGPGAYRLEGGIDLKWIQGGRDRVDVSLSIQRNAGANEWINVGEPIAFAGQIDKTFGSRVPGSEKLDRLIRLRVK